MRLLEKLVKWKCCFTTKNIAIISSTLAVLIITSIALFTYQLSNLTTTDNRNSLSSPLESAQESSRKTSSVDSSMQPQVSETISDIPITSTDAQTLTETETSKVQPCHHNYRNEVVPPTCSEQGYTIHTCQNCGYQYIDCYTAPQHDYGKYLCINCGMPDPSTDPFYALNAWMAKNVPYNEEIQGYEWIYQVGDKKYIISTLGGGDAIVLQYCFGDEDLDLYFSASDFLDTYYSKGEEGGRYLMDKSDLIVPSKPLFDKDFAYMSQEFVEQYSKRIDETINVAQNQMLSTIGMNLKSFGFPSL